MRFYYRILSANEKEHTFVVRYWTDKFTEKDLRIRDDDHEDPPQRCRTDYNLTGWKHDLTPDQLHEYIVQSAPKAWFEILEKAADGQTQTMANVQELVNINKECHLTEVPKNKSNQ